MARQSRVSSAKTDLFAPRARLQPVACVGGGFAFAIARAASDGALIELGSAIRPLASLNPNLIGRPIARRPLPGALLVPVRPREAVLHPAVAMANPDVEVWAVGLHGVVFRQ